MKALEYKIDSLLDIASKEKDSLRFLLTGLYSLDGQQKSGLEQIVRETLPLQRMVKTLPSIILTTKEEMDALLENIKEQFCMLTGISPMDNPELVVISKSRYLRAAQAAHRLTKKLASYSSAAALLSAIGGAPALALFALGLYGLTFLGSYAYAFCAIKTACAYTMNPKISDSIFIPPAKEEVAAFILAHEYAHNVRHKLGLYTGDDFLEEGVATAVAHEVLGSMKTTKPICSAFASLNKISCICATCTALLIQSGNKVDMPKFILNFLEGKTIFYSVGSSAVHLAEFKYGKEVYKELFKGKYDCLLD